MVSGRNAVQPKVIFKGVLWVALVAYLVLPLYLYGFTPMGVSVLRLINQNLAAKKAAQIVGLATTGEADEEQAGLEPLPAKDQPFAILLLGYGGPGHDGAYLTDSMILAIADPKSRSVSLLSIPRDTLVKLPLDQKGEVSSKINTAYAYGVDDRIYPRRPTRYKGPRGGGNLAKDAVSGVVGIPIRYYIAVDFKAFRKMIDEVGGVEVTVRAPFSVLFPKEDNPSVDPDWMVVRFEAGRQNMTGERALQYARARETIENVAEGNDFARSRRQRQIMQAFKDKLLSPGGLVHLPALLGIAKERVDTDMEVPSLGDLQQLLTDWRGAKITEVSLTTENYFTSEASTPSAYFLLPVAGQNDWSQIHAFVRVLISDPLLAEEMARTKVVVRNGSGNPEKGKELRAKLMSQGFAVAPLESVPLQPSTRIEDMTEDGVPHLVQSLKAVLGDVDVTARSSGSSSPRVAIVLGQDQLPNKP